MSYRTCSLGAEVSQDPLDRFSQSLHHMVGIEWQMISPTFFRYLKGRCHGNQFSTCQIVQYRIIDCLSDRLIVSYASYIFDVFCLTEAARNISMATVGLCVIKKSAKTAKLDNVFEHIFTPRIYQVNYAIDICDSYVHVRCDKQRVWD